jgi:hypothetical protein
VLVVDADRSISTMSSATCSPSIWITGRSSLEMSLASHSSNRCFDSATNRRDGEADLTGSYAIMRWCLGSTHNEARRPCEAT